MGCTILRCAVWLGILVSLLGCQAQTPVSLRPTVPTRIAATRRPAHTPTATHTPLPTLTPTATHTPSPTPFPDVTWAELSNLDYPNEWAEDGVAEMIDGVYREPADVDGGEGLVVTVADVVAFGDLNGDHEDDVAILLLAYPGDGRSYTYLTIVSGRAGDAAVITTLPLGATLPFRSMAITTGRLTLELLAYAPDDARCCPSMDSRRIYELADAGLTLVTQWDGPRQQSSVPPIPGRAWLPFVPGTAATRVRGSLYPLGDQRYALQGEGGQWVDLAVTSPYERVFVSFHGLADGVVLAGIASEITRWSGRLPSTQVYEIRLVSVAGSATSYVLSAAVDPLLSTPTPVAEPVMAATTMLTSTLVAPLIPTLTQTQALTAVVVLPTPDRSTVSAQSAVPGGELLYLTFDGKSENTGWAEVIADVLQSYGVLGTFFLSEPAAPESRALLRSGHAVGLHAAAAQTLDFVGRQALMAQLSSEAFTTPCVRLAYGAMDAYTRAQVAEMGISVVLWDTSHAASSTDPESAAAAFLSRVRPGAVLRFQVRDDGAWVSAMLAEILPVLKEQGYDFGLVCHGEVGE